MNWLFIDLAATITAPKFAKNSKTYDAVLRETQSMVYSKVMIPKNQNECLRVGNLYFGE